MLILKHVRNWSYETLEREVRANVVYRTFCRIGMEKVPRAAAEVYDEWHAAVVAQLRKIRLGHFGSEALDRVIASMNLHDEPGFWADGILIVAQVGAVGGSCLEQPAAGTPATSSRRSP
jgi:hypothetical protein